MRSMRRPLAVARDPDGTTLVAVAAEAPEGELDDSVADEVLRSIAVAG